MCRGCLIWLSLFFGLPIALLIALLGLNYSGFCMAKMRYLSDEEKIKGIFEYQNNRNKLPVDLPGLVTRDFHHIKYKSFEEFIQENPDCCVINPGGSYDIPPPLLLERISGYNSGDLVVINFKVRYLDHQDNKKIGNYVFKNYITNCGEAC